MRVLVAADHAGIELKAEVARLLAEGGHDVDDLGPSSTDSVDYPDYAHELAGRLAAGEAERGVLVCGSGVGMAMAANRHAGVRAVNSTDLYSVRMSRAHNDANVLCLGQRVVGAGLAAALLEAFLDTDFEGGRHARRVGRIELDRL